CVLARGHFASHLLVRSSRTGHGHRRTKDSASHHMEGWGCESARAAIWHDGCGEEGGRLSRLLLGASRDEAMQLNPAMAALGACARLIATGAQGCQWTTQTSCGGNVRRQSRWIHVRCWAILWDMQQCCSQ